MECDSLHYKLAPTIGLKNATDEYLMQEVSEGNLDAMSTLFERYQKWIYNFFYQMTSNAMLCEDLTQQTFYKAIKYRTSYKGGKFASWIFQIARNLGYDHFEKEKRAKKTAEELFAVQRFDMGTELDDGPSEETVQLHAALQKLSATDRELIVLSKLQQMKYKEIATITESNEVAVKTKVHRAIKKLRTIYFEKSHDRV